MAIYRARLSKASERTKVILKSLYDIGGSGTTQDILEHIPNESNAKFDINKKKISQVLWRLSQMNFKVKRKLVNGKMYFGKIPQVYTLSESVMKHFREPDNADNQLE